MCRFLVLFVFLSCRIFANDAEIGLVSDSLVNEKSYDLFVQSYRYFTQNKSDSAFLKMEELDDYLSQGDYPVLAIHYRSLGSAISAKFGFFKQSLKKSIEAEEMGHLELDSLHDEWGVVYGNFAYYFNALGLEDRALEYMNRAQVILRVNKEENPIVLIENTFNLASKAQNKNDFKTVLSLFDEVEEYLPYLKPKQITIRIKYYTKKAKFYLGIGREIEGGRLLQKAISLMDEHDISDFKNLKLKHDLLAFYYYRIGKREDELVHRQKLEELYTVEIINVGRLANLHNMAMAYEFLEQNEKAMSIHKRTLALQKEIGGFAYYDLLTYLSQVSVLEAMQRYREALELCDFAIQFAQENDLVATFGYPELFLLKASILQDLGANREDIEKEFRISIKYFKMQYSSSHSKLAEIYLEYAGFLKEQGENKMALTQLDLAKNANLIVQDSQEESVIGKHVWSPKLNYKIALERSKYTGELNREGYSKKEHLLSLEGALADLRMYIRSLAHMDQKMAQFSVMDSLSSKIVGLCFTLDKADSPDYFFKALSTAEDAHGILLQENLTMYSTYKRSDVSEDLIAEIKSRKGEIEGYRALLLENPSDSIYDILTGKLMSLVEFKQGLFSVYPKLSSSRDLKVLSKKDIVNSIGEDELLVSYYMSENHLYIFYNSHSDHGWERIPFQAAEFAKEVKGYREAVKDSDFEQFGKHSYAIYQLLIAPISDRIEGRKLVIIPHGLLSTIAFDCLITEPIGAMVGFNKLDYLIKENSIEYAYGIRMFCSEDAYPIDQNKYLGIAPDYSGYEDLKAIPMAEEEIIKVSELFNGVVLSKEKASERGLRSSLKQANLVHIAAHAHVDSKHVYNSKIILSATGDSLYDDQLFAHELLNLPVSANLVVLNACSSGAGELVRSEGVMSLGRSLKYAGANSVIMNLWDVSDKHSSTLLGGFFKSFKNHESAAVALRNEKINYLENADAINAAPLFWAAPVLLGRPVPIKADGDFEIWIYCLLIIGSVLIWRLFKKGPKRRSKN